MYDRMEIKILMDEDYWVARRPIRENKEIQIKERKTERTRTTLVFDKKEVTHGTILKDM